MSEECDEKLLSQTYHLQHLSLRPLWQEDNRQEEMKDRLGRKTGITASFNSKAVKQTSRYDKMLA